VEKPTINLETLLSIFSLTVNRNPDTSLDGMLEQFQVPEESLTLEFLNKAKEFAENDPSIDRMIKEIKARNEAVQKAKDDLDVKKAQLAEALTDKPALVETSIGAELDEDEPLAVFLRDRKSESVEEPAEEVIKPVIEEVKAATPVIEEDEDETIQLPNVSFSAVATETDIPEVESKTDVEETSSKQKGSFFDDPDGFLADMFSNIDIDAIDDAVVLKKSKKGNALAQIVDNNLSKVKATETVTCIGSKYRANISALSLDNKHAIRNSMGSAKELLAKTFRVIYNSIESSTPKKPNYDAWLKMTAFTDLESLYYGILAASYRTSEQSVDVRCSSCGKANTLKFYPNDLLEIKSEKTFQEFERIMREVKNFADLAEHSVLSKTNRIILPSTKALVYLRIPSLNDYLTDSNNTKLGDTIAQYSLFIRQFYILDVVKTRAERKPVYYSLDDVNEFVRYFQNLPDDDLLAIQTGADALAEDFGINYRLKEHVCSHCKAPNSQTGLDLGNLLFTLVGGK
jgi:hypothetical protein